MRLIDADIVVTIQVYDDITGKTDTKKMTIAEAIDEWSDEGCPPTVEAEPVRHGRWVKNDEYSDEIEGHIVYECSECGELYYWFDVPEHKYCRHCGAKMDLPESIVYPQVEGITPTVVKMDEVTE